VTPVSLLEADLQGVGPYAVISRGLDDLAAANGWAHQESWDDLDRFKAVVLDPGASGLIVLLQYAGQPAGTSNVWLFEAQPEPVKRHLLDRVLAATGLAAADVQWRRTPLQPEPASLARAV
jgi:hypothetical protein